MWLSIPIPFYLRLPNLARHGPSPTIRLPIPLRWRRPASRSTKLAIWVVRSLRQFQKTVKFDAAPQLLSGLQLIALEISALRASSLSSRHATQAACDCGVGAPA